MKTRCKPGDIAVFINQRNLGKLVAVIRPYEIGTVVTDCKWSNESRPGPMWVVESIGGPIQVLDGDSDAMVPYTIAATSDSCLRPLREGPGQDEMLRLTGKPKDKPVVAKKRARPTKQKEVPHV